MTKSAEDAEAEKLRSENVGRNMPGYIGFKDLGKIGIVQMQIKNVNSNVKAKLYICNVEQSRSYQSWYD
jgi:hypothetical protein